ncbi:MAG: dihydrofolate reductase [Myxococcota bacterium]
MADQTHTIGASSEAGNAARFDVLPPALHEVMPRLYEGPYVAVGLTSAGPFLCEGRPGQRTFVLSRDANARLPLELSDLELCTDAEALARRFVDDDAELVVVGGKAIFSLFLPYARKIDIAETDVAVPGDVVFSAWADGCFVEDTSERWAGGRTRHLVRR